MTNCIFFIVKFIWKEHRSCLSVSEGFQTSFLQQKPKKKHWWLLYVFTELKTCDILSTHAPHIYLICFLHWRWAITGAFLSSSRNNRCLYSFVTFHLGKIPVHITTVGWQHQSYYRIWPMTRVQSFSSSYRTLSLFCTTLFGAVEHLYSGVSEGKHGRLRGPSVLVTKRSFLLLVIIRITDLNMVFSFCHILFDFTVLVKDELQGVSGCPLFISAGRWVKPPSRRYLKFS